MDAGKHIKVLVEEAQEGSRAASGQLVDTSRDRLEALVPSRLGARLRLEVAVEDVVQETLLQAFRSINLFSRNSTRTR